MLIHTLKTTLGQAIFGLSRHRIDLLCKLLPALIQTRTVNLRTLACALPGLATIDSQYCRLQRFFSSGLCPSVFTQLIVDKLVVAGQPMLLVLDRTHWQLGQTDLNLLCLGLVFQGVSIPLVSRSLRRPGNSHTRERKQVMRQALSYLKGSTCCLLADREFIGKDWFRFLLGQRELTFVIRIRCTGRVTLDDGLDCDASPPPPRHGGPEGVLRGVEQRETYFSRPSASSGVIGPPRKAMRTPGRN